MSYIDRDALGINYTNRAEYIDPSYADGWNLAVEIIQNAPSADVAPIRHARWIDNGNGTVSCSGCQTWFPKEREPYLQWCGHCGAKMDVEVEE